jgi:hypothetical protein
MHRQGVALVFGLLVIVVLSILLGSFFMSTMSENNLVKRYVNSARAFWAAEAGIADAARSLSNTGTVNIGAYTYYNATIGSPEKKGYTTYYNIISTGFVVLPSGEKLERHLKVVVNAEDVRNENFPYALASTSNIEITGNAAEITGEGECANCTGKDCNCDINSTPKQCCGERIAYPSFVGLFGIDQETMRAQAIAAGQYYDDANFTSPVSNITWVEGDLSLGGDNLRGTGILIVTGNTTFTGNVDFKGIVYSTGQVTLKGGGGGDPNISGSIISASNTTVEDTDLHGKVYLQRNETWIGNALNSTRPLVDKAISFWKED